jgi:Spy/CpxP family protein refolding chaperone
MKKLLIAASALFIIAGAAQAQTAQSDTAKFRKHQRGAFAHHKGSRGMQNLNLSEDQKKQFKELNESYRKQITDLNNQKLTADERKTRFQALRKEQSGKMQTLLTAEQKAQMTAKRKEFGEKSFRTGGRGFDRSKGFEQMKTKLGLSEDQAAKLKASRQGFHDKMKAIHSDNTLSADQKKEQKKALAQQQRERMKTILTPEQLEKLKAGRKHKDGSK